MIVNRSEVWRFIALCMVISALQGCLSSKKQEERSKGFQLEEDFEAETISVKRKGGKDPLIVQNVKAGMRPYLHPIMTPDGNSTLTEYSPGHHQHQTGLYWGFTRVNGSGAPADTLKKWFYNREKPERIKDQIGRDFFHFNGDTHWKKVVSKILLPEGSKVTWQTIYHMLDANGESILEETMQWSLTEEENKFLLDLEWQGRALQDVVINEFSYGGMFLRMPWKKGIDGVAINSAGQVNEEAEGQKAKWVDVGMEIEGLADWGHIAILDNTKNENFPTAWRVDGQLGIGPCRAIEGDWHIKEGATEIFKYRIIAYSGTSTNVDMEEIYQDYQGGD